ncbi:MAG: hypothetical protein AB8G17_09845 [Gammaproteobacteria bacterium]
MASAPPPPAAASLMDIALDEARSDPARLQAFMREFPKGGDIHHHLIGAPTPQMLIEIGAERRFCLQRKTLEAIPGPCMHGSLSFERVLTDPDLRGALEAKWSMRGFGAGDARAPDHFFGIFPQIWSVVDDRGLLLARLKQDAAAENLGYLETQLQTPAPTEALRALAMGLPPTDDVMALRAALSARTEFEPLVRQAIATIDAYDATSAEALGCATTTPKAGCRVAHRYQYYALRILPTPMVLADMILAFEVAHRAPQVVGVNVVGFEGDANALRHYGIHMRALAALGQLFPEVPISLHAGEITAREADEEALKTHVPDALYVAGAKRIGHGNSIAQSANRDALLEDLAFTATTVEVSLTSNELLLGRVGDEHHLPLLLDAGVPVTLNTDDAGIFVTTLSREYALAATRYPSLTYADFQSLSRQALIAAFIEGSGIWDEGNRGQRVAACRDFGAASCRSLIASSPRAALQVDLEQRFKTFEQRWLQQLAAAN